MFLKNLPKPLDKKRSILYTDINPAQGICSWTEYVPEGISNTVRAIWMSTVLFNETHYRKDKELLDIENKSIILRNAVRAVVIIENKILMVHLQKTGEYKFPGGGRDENETIEEALEREVLEEVGYKVVKTCDKIGTITEYDTAKEGDSYVFKMVSEYYLAEVENKQLEQNLEEYDSGFDTFLTVPRLPCVARSWVSNPSHTIILGDGHVATNAVSANSDPGKS